MNNLNKYLNKYDELEKLMKEASKTLLTASDIFDNFIEDPSPLQDLQQIEEMKEIREDCLRLANRIREVTDSVQKGLPSFLFEHIDTIEEGLINSHETLSKMLVVQVTLN